MALIVVGGQIKDVGKTTLVCNIIAAFSQFHWTAAKITTHTHDPLDCELLVQTDEYSIWREIGQGLESDTARFLRAGAANAFMVETKPRNVQSACEEFLKQREGHIILESTVAAEFLHPALFLLLVKGSEKIKKSATDQLKRANAFVLRGPPEKQVLVAKDKPIFEARRDGLDPKLYSLIAKLLA